MGTRKKVLTRPYTKFPIVRARFGRLKGRASGGVGDAGSLSWAVEGRACSCSSVVAAAAPGSGSASSSCSVWVCTGWRGDHVVFSHIPIA